MELNQTNLKKLDKAIGVPSYERSKIITSIVHIGVGGFHRSHQAYYLHQLMEKTKQLDWGICGVGLREADRSISEVLTNQDGLYTLVTQNPDKSEDIEVIGSIAAFLLAVDNPQKVIDKMAQKEVKIVSLTITEGGYNFNMNTGEFIFENPDIQNDMVHPENPRTVYGFLIAALRKRMESGIEPFTILSCDNIQHNGDMTKKMVLAFAQKTDTNLADWISHNVSFPNSMVDRITPVTSKEAIKKLEDKYLLKDAWPVVCEPYLQWVVEDDFCNGRPSLETVDVQFVKDVTPYEKMKIRLLNAGHSVLGITGAIHGHATINACMEDKVFSDFMRCYMDEEVTPILDPVEGIDLDDYKDSLEDRFANPNIKDSVSRICSESSAKLPKFLIPTLKENLDAGGSIKYATFILASWCYYSDKETNEKGEYIDILDNSRDALHKAAIKTKTNPTAFLNLSEIFGSLNQNERFLSTYKKMIGKLYTGNTIKQIMTEILGT